MTELLTAAQMRAIERAAIESGAVTGLELMERAGQGVVNAIFAQWPELATVRGAAPSPLSLGPIAQQRRPPEFMSPDEGQGRRAVVLCGPGNNGGDGFVVARLLQQEGWAVEVFLYGDAEKLPPVARVNYVRWVAVGAVRDLVDFDATSGTAPDVLVDAVFGIGLDRPIATAVADKLKVQSRMAWATAKVVAVDCPSGLDIATGNADRFMALATAGYPDKRPINLSNLTVTFHAPKLGHYINNGPSVCGAIHVVDIGLWPWDRDEAIPGLQPTVDRSRLMDARYQGKEFRRGPMIFGMLEKSSGHKYDHGHALILSGGVGRGGAARMAARGALRIGAGAVTLGCPPAALIENAAQVNAVMLRRVKDAEGLAEVLEDKRINALCLGPGLGTGEREVALVEGALKRTLRGGVCLDADALTILSRDAGLFAALHDRCVMTPHAGEFARLFPDLAEKLDAPAINGPAYSKVDATREAAKRAGCVVLFKGPDTVIADPDGRCSVNAAVYDRAVPWLATAGAGDVLAGFITGLLARGFAPMQAAEAAAWLHVECARSFGPGLIAEDLPEALPGVLRGLGL